MLAAPLIKRLDKLQLSSVCWCQEKSRSVVHSTKTKVSKLTYRKGNTMHSPMKKRIKSHHSVPRINEDHDSSSSSFDSPCPSPNSNLHNRVLKIAVEGNIATGKSSFIHLLDHAKQEWAVIPEPVAKWTNVSTSCDQHNDDITSSQQHGGNLLKLFYDDINRWAYTFQSYVLFR